MFSFPTFIIKHGEDVKDFLENFEIACIISTRKDDDVLQVCIFPFLKKVKERFYHNAFPQATKDNWKLFKIEVKQCFRMGVTCEHLW